MPGFAAALFVIACASWPPSAASGGADQAAAQAPATEPTIDEPTVDELLKTANAAQGKLMYLQCRDCHSLENDDIVKVGPSLQGLLGSTAGQVEGFDYSDVLVESGIVWTPRSLDELLARPGEFLPGNRMVFAGIGDPEDRANLILYLQQATRAADEQKPVIALFGATARSGREIIRQGLERGYTIKGFARTPSKLGIEHENLTLYKGDIYDRASIDVVLDGDEVVLSMIGRGTPADPLAEVGPVDIYTVMGENLISAMKEKGNTRLIMASSTGVEHRADVDSAKPPPGDMSNMWRWNARHLYNDMYEMEKMIEASGLDYLLLRPGFMVEEPARNDMQFNTSGNTPAARVITYEDFAAFILDHVEGGDYWNTAVGMYSDTVMDPAAEVAKFLERQKAAQQAGQQKSR